ncbi:MAG: DUF4054 domain-containing protein [Pseudomonadota bacterium]
MAITLASKAPDERIAYLWTPPLATGDSIAVAPAPSAILISGTAATDGVSIVGSDVKIWLIGGTDGEVSQFLVECDTLGGETLQETLYLPISSTALSALGAQLITIWPAFAAVDPAAINYWLDEALIVANWGNDNARMLLAAHYMAINGLGTNAVTGGLTSFKSGSVDMKFSEAQANTIGFAQTIYGQQFSILLRRRHAGPRTIAVGRVGCPC